MHRSIAHRLFFVVALMALAVASFAQTSGSWSPPTVDYAGNTQTAVTSLGTLASNVLPAIMGLFVIFLGIKMLPVLIKKFIH